METRDYSDPVEQMIAKRLARLGSLPIDTTQLDKSMRAEIPMPVPAWRRMLRPVTAVAASLIILTIVGVMFFASRPALASAADMAQMHRDLIAGKIATMKVDSMEEANQAIAAFAGNFPRLAEPPQSQAMACCMRSVGNKKVACVLLSNGDTPVSVMVADTNAVQTPSVSPTIQDGQMYYVQSVDNLHMVMTNRQNHWICLIGELPADKLMELSGGLKFTPVP